MERFGNLNATTALELDLHKGQAINQDGDIKAAGASVLAAVVNHNLIAQLPNIVVGTRPKKLNVA